MASVDVIEVKKSFRGPAVLRNLSFAIEDGEMVALLGASGSGKTTLARLLAGLEQVDAGEICIAGKAVTRLPPMYRDVAMIGAKGGLYPHLTLRENLGFPLKLRRLTARQIVNRLAPMADRLGLSDALDDRPETLDPALYRRAVLCRAILRSPHLLVLDEPFAGVDRPQREASLSEYRDLLRELAITTLYLTADQDQARGLAARILVMASGQIEQTGSAADLYDRPASMAVAGMLGWPQMAFISGRLSEDAQSFLARDGTFLPLPSGPLPEASFGAALVYGLRPAAISRSITSEIELEVLGAEDTGAEMRLHASLAGTPLTCRVPRQSMKRGDKVTVSIDPGGIHLFDRSSGKRL